MAKPDEEVRHSRDLDIIATVARNCAPAVAAYYKELVRQGMQRDDALELAKDFSRAYFGTITGKKM